MEKNPIALNIRRLRQSRHWSQEELAAASGVDVRTIQRAESGRPLALESLKALAAGFDTTIDALSASPEDVTRLLDEFREKYSLIGLRPLQAAADLQTFLPQADAFLLQRIGTMSDEQADEVAIFEQEFKGTTAISGASLSRYRGARPRDISSRLSNGFGRWTCRYHSEQM